MRPAHCASSSLGNPVEHQSLTPTLALYRWVHLFTSAIHQLGLISLFHPTLSSLSPSLALAASLPPQSPLACIWSHLPALPLPGLHCPVSVSMSPRRADSGACCMRSSAVPLTPREIQLRSALTTPPAVTVTGMRRTTRTQSGQHVTRPVARRRERCRCPIIDLPYGPGRQGYGCGGAKTIARRGSISVELGQGRESRLSPP